MYPKDFIKNVLINEYKDIVDSHPYLSFALIGIGIEFVGKCILKQHKSWEINPDTAFKAGLKLLIDVDVRYEKLYLKDSLRNGLVHSLLPKSKIALSEIKNGAIHFNQNTLGQTVLVAEIFYRDFVIICNEVVNETFDEKDKMNKPFLRVGN